MSKRGVKVNSIKGLKKIKENIDVLFVRLKRDKWERVCISDMTTLEFIDVLIGWIKQKRRY